MVPSTSGHVESGSVPVNVTRPSSLAAPAIGFPEAPSPESVWESTTPGTSLSLVMARKPTISRDAASAGASISGDALPSRRPGHDHARVLHGQALETGGRLVFEWRVTNRFCDWLELEEREDVVLEVLGRIVLER